ncbi:MAG: hydantoinase B/oxoprolinase family protein [Rhizobiaceae bacterium]
MSAPDPVSIAVISQSLLAAAREMGTKLCRSAYSSIVREVKDASAGILDAQGRAVAQCDHLTPMLVGSLSLTLKACMGRYPVETIREGDFYINNHPYAGGHHSNDIFIFMPIFFDGRLLGFSASVAHHVDIGGGAVGINHSATDYYQEGLVLPPSRYNLERDWNDGPLEQLIRANVRVPEQTLGDLNAQFAANRVGILRVQELCAKYGVDLVAAAMDEFIGYAERRMRTAIEAIPDGVYRGEDQVDDDGRSDTPLGVKVTLTVSGSSIEVDYAGTCDQVISNLNSPWCSTVSATLACLKTVLTSADIPFNEGVMNPITIRAPLGSLLNPRSPAPVRARMEAVYRAYDSILKALAPIVPDRVGACGFDTSFSFALAYQKNGRYQVHQEVYYGGYGASMHGDGCDSVASPLSNCTNVPVEALDMMYDFFHVTDYALRADSCGDGKYRGGLGFRRVYAIRENGVRLSIYADRFRFPSTGMAGGGDGATASCRIRRGDEVIEVRSKDALVLQAGDIVTVETGGGGGYGDPRERSPAARELDRTLGYVR